MKLFTPMLILGGLVAAADGGWLRGSRSSKRSKSPSRRYYWYKNDCGTVQLVLGDDKQKTLDCARRVKDNIEDEFMVSASQSIDTDATDSNYSEDSRDEVTIYIDLDIIKEDGCDEVIDDALDEVDDELAERCEFDKHYRWWKHSSSSSQSSRSSRTHTSSSDGSIKTTSKDKPTPTSKSKHSVKPSLNKKTSDDLVSNDKQTLTDKPTSTSNKSEKPPRSPSKPKPTPKPKNERSVKPTRPPKVLKTPKDKKSPSKGGVEV